MNLITIVVFTAFFGQQLVHCQIECDVNSLKVAFPDSDHVIYGLREDKNILLLPSKIMQNSSLNEKLKSLLDENFDLTEELTELNAMLIEVHGLLQFITVWREKINEFYTLTRIAYFEAFRLVFIPTHNKILYKPQLTTLAYFPDIRFNYFSFKTTSDSRVFFHQIGDDRTGSYQIVFGRTGTKLFIDKIFKIVQPWIEPVDNLKTVTSKTTKWMARCQKSAMPEIRCIMETKSKYGVGILYNRKNLIGAYYEMGTSVLDCKEMNCKTELRSDGGKKYHDQEVDPIYKKGSIFLGFRNGYIFSYKVNNEKEKFSEILFLLDLAHRPAEKAELGANDELHLFSIDGKEAIAVICGPKSYYRIYNIDPRNDHKIIYLKKSNMTVIKGLQKKCRKVDYDAKNAKLIFFVDISTAKELPLTYNHDGVLKSYPDPKLVRFDNFLGNREPYEGIESKWPLHYRNKRILYYHKESKAIEMRYNRIDSNGKSVPHNDILTKFGNYVKSLLYFPIEYIEDEYMEWLRKKSNKFPISFYGVTNCIVFVMIKFEDFANVKLNGTGCDQSYQMRAILLDSYITVLRTKDGKNVDALRIKISLDYNHIMKGIKGSEALVYTHNLVDSEFEKNNSFTIVPGTFNTIHNIDEFTYYQYKQRNKCTYHFRRRKITKQINKEIKDIEFPILSVSYRKFMQYPCDFELSSAMYDESVRGVVYVMRRKSETVLATPNTIVTDVLKSIMNEKFLANYIYSTSFPYVLYNDSNGASVLSVEDPSDVKITFNTVFDTIGIYTGKILYRQAKTRNILHAEAEAIEERIDQAVVTKPIAKRDFEKAAFGIESEIIGRPELHTRKCRLINAPFFMPFILKVAALDLLLLLVVIIIVIYHRAHIIPARRRYKIKMGILRHRKKRKLRERARRRLRKLNLLRRRREVRQAQLFAMAVGRLGRQKDSEMKQKKKSESTSSSDLITAEGKLTLQSKMQGVPEYSPGQGQT